MTATSRDSQVEMAVVSLIHETLHFPARNIGYVYY